MSLTTQQSILIGFVAAGCLIGGAVYFGLSSGRNGPSGDSAATLSTPGRNTDRPGPGAQPEVRPVQQPAQAPTANAAQVTADAKSAVEAQRPALLKKCWEASAPAGSAGLWKATFNITFDGAGTQISRGIMEDRSTTRHEVTDCINNNLPTLKIPAPGAIATAEVPMSMP